MEWTHFATGLAGAFIGSFLMTVWQNERRRRSTERNREWFAEMWERGRWYPPATQDPPPLPPAPPRPIK
jgi:hypothetical protein